MRSYECTAQHSTAQQILRERPRRIGVLLGGGVNVYRRAPAETKWTRHALKSRWYEEHVGFGASPAEVIDNRLRAASGRLESGDVARSTSIDGTRLVDASDATWEHE